MEKKELPVLAHFIELRKRLIVSAAALAVFSIVSFLFYDYIITLLSLPFEMLEESQDRLFIHSVLEGFTVKIRVSLVSGALFSLPVHLFNLVKFIMPGLVGKERKIFAATLFSSFVLIFFSILYGYLKIVPISIQFLTGSGFIPADTGLLLNFGKNIFYIFRLIFVSVLVFQLPVLLITLMVLGVLRRKILLRASRFVIVGIFALSAILTPPDFVSQLSLALPLIVLFFLSILIAKIFRFGG